MRRSVTRSEVPVVADDVGWLVFCACIGDPSSGSRSAIKVKAVLSISIRPFQIRHSLLQRGDSHTKYRIQSGE